MTVSGLFSLLPAPHPQPTSHALQDHSAALAVLHTRLTADLQAAQERFDKQLKEHTDSLAVVGWRGLGLVPCACVLGDDL